MSLDLASTAAQIDGMARDLRVRRGERDRRLQRAVSVIRGLSVEGHRLKREELGDDLPWGVADVLETPGRGYAPPPRPEEFRVVAVDGSHIATDRHLAARCFLVNVGVSALTYGRNADARLFNRPRLYARGEEMVIRDSETRREQPIEGAVLGAKRAVDEIQEVVRAIEEMPEDLPTVALIDGPLVMLSLSGHSYDSFVVRELVEEGFVRALEELRQMAKSRQLAVAGYISLPGSVEVVNALRLEVCPYGVMDRYRCRSSEQDARPCDVCVGELRDREVFAQVLSPGERSGAFATSSPIVEHHYGGHGVQFFYVNTGHEIGRVEVPWWVAGDEAAMGLVHSLIVDQCHLGKGYPVALMEAHEQAVITAADRRYFVQLVEQALHAEGLPVYTSEKDRSKRIRML